LIFCTAKQVPHVVPDLPDSDKRRCPVSHGHAEVVIRITCSCRAADPDEKLTLAEVRKELRIERSTFYDWRARAGHPKCSKLPNGELRIVRRDLDEWFELCRVA
jgi:predicted DNA-binding transcriptional regulator AlpA